MKGNLLVEESDIPRLASIMNMQWEQELAKNGLAHVAPKAPADGQGIPCPACGHTAPLENGACADCGLVLG